LSPLEAELLLKIKNNGPFDFPGGLVRAYFRGRKIVDLRYGKTWKYYDIASLTKILFTTSVIMRLVEDGRLSLTAPLKKLLPWHPFQGVSLKDLLCHSAGYVDWLPFYKGLDLQLSPDLRQQQLFRAIRDVRPGSKSVSKYSDIDFFLLGAALQQACQAPLLKIWQNFQQEFFPDSTLHFSPDNKSPFPKKDYAPTERCPWRGKTLRGEVHDDNCWALGGVAPHAGLFGTIDDVSAWVLAIRKVQRGGKGFVQGKTLQRFTKSSMPARQGYWGLGFMKPSPQSTAGQYFSKDSYGHTGFTGTSIWMDPKRDLQVILLSNRVHPSRKNRDFVELRPKIHDWIAQAVSP